MTDDLYDPLRELAAQTNESSARELHRILYVLRHGLFLLTRYLEGQGGNRHLARWLAVEEGLARRAFGEWYDVLLQALYGDRPHRLFRLAAENLLDAGRPLQARQLLLCAQAQHRLDEEGISLLHTLDAAEGHLERAAS